MELLLQANIDTLNQDIERNLARIANLVGDDVINHPLVVACSTLLSHEIEAMEAALKSKSHLLAHAQNLFNSTGKNQYAL